MEISLAPESIFFIGSFPVTNTVLVTFFLSLLIIVSSIILRSKLKLIPKGFQNVIEYVLESFLNLIDSVTQDREQSKKFFPLVVTIFIFVILSNWVELIPGLGTIGINEEIHGKTILVPFLRSTSADLNATLAIAIVAVFSIQFMGIMAIGFFSQSFQETFLCGGNICWSSGNCWRNGQSYLIFLSSFWEYFCRRSSIDCNAKFDSLFCSAPIFISRIICRVHSSLGFFHAHVSFSENGCDRPSLNLTIEVYFNS